MQITTAYLGELGLDSFKGGNKMGRPIKKSKMAGNASGVAGNIAVTAYRPQGGALNNSTTAYIMSQRGSKCIQN